MAKWFYGFFETYPARFTFHEAKVLIDGVWRKFNAAGSCQSHPRPALAAGKAKLG